jgi:hypothetical protein
VSFFQPASAGTVYHRDILFSSAAAVWVMLMPSVLVIGNFSYGSMPVHVFSASARFSVVRVLLSRRAT